MAKGKSFITEFLESSQLTPDMFNSGHEMLEDSLKKGSGRALDMNDPLMLVDLGKLTNIMVDPETNLVNTVDYEDIKHFDVNVIRAFCLIKGIYVIPTYQLCDWLHDAIGEDNLSRTIEIGAGNGAIARDLEIKATDSKIQKRAEVRRLYEDAKQMIVQYPKDVITMDAASAIKKLKPSYVIGCFITRKYKLSEHDLGGSVNGVDEAKVVRNVKKYYMVGSEHVHEPISALFRHPHINVVKHRNIPGVIDRSMLNDTVIYECSWGLK